MFSDNENPGAEVSADKPLPPPHRRRKQSTQLGRRKNASGCGEITRYKCGCPASGEPAAVTVSPAEPIAAPDGAATVEHST